MPADADMADRHSAALGRLAQLGLSLAERLHGQAMAAETPEDAVALAGAFHRISRGVRQTLALEARLERERHRAEREAADAALSRTAARVERLKARVRGALAREIWTEYESAEDEADEALRALDQLLAEDALGDDFAERPSEAVIARLRYDLGLRAPGGVEGGGDTEGDAEGGALPEDAGFGPRRGLFVPPLPPEAADRAARVALFRKLGLNTS